MKKILQLVLLLALSFSVSGATIYDSELTVTNSPTTNGMTLVVNSNTRRFTNSVSAPSTQIVTNNSIGGIVTNVFQQISAYPFPGVRAFITATNKIKLSSTNTITASLGGNWGTFTNSSTSGDSGSDIRVPLSIESASVRTNKASLLVTGLNDYSTNALDQNATILSNTAGLTNTQTISGRKTFTGVNIHSNSAQQWIGGTNSFTAGLITNGLFKSPILSSATLTNPTVKGVIEMTDNFIRFWEGGGIKDSTDAVRIQVEEGFLNDQSGNPAVGWQSRQLLNDSGQPSLDWSSAEKAFYGDDGTTIIGRWSGNAFKFNKVLQTNSAFYGSSTNNGDISFTRYDNASLANGNNAAVNPGTNVYIKVSGPSAAFTINGISGGRDGRVLEIQNSTGYAMTIANDSGTDPTAANRIYTGTGADVTFTNAIVSLTFRYDSSVSRWILKTVSGNSSSGVTSVAMTVPTGLSVSGSPVTSSGTLAVSTSLNGIVKGNGSGFGTVSVGTGLSYDGTTLSASQTALSADLNAANKGITNLSYMKLGETIVTNGSILYSNKSFFVWDQVQGHPGTAFKLPSNTNDIFNSIDYEMGTYTVNFYSPVADNHPFMYVTSTSETGATVTHALPTVVGSGLPYMTATGDDTSGTLELFLPTTAGDLTVNGKFTATGGVDPPYLLLDANTRASVKARVLIEVPKEKQTGAAQFFNSATHKMEFYVASEDKFYDILGTELKSPTAAEVSDASAVISSKKLKEVTDRKTRSTTNTVQRVKK